MITRACACFTCPLAHVSCANRLSLALLAISAVACTQGCSYVCTQTVRVYTCTRACVHTHSHSHAHTQIKRRARMLAQCAEVHGLPVPSARREKGTHSSSRTLTLIGPRLVGRSLIKAWSCRGSSSSMARLISLMICKCLAASEGSIGSYWRLPARW